MANLEIQIGADSSELNAEIVAAEQKIKRLGKLKVERIKLGLDVKELNSDIVNAKSQLSGLKKSVDTAGGSFNSMAPKVANGGNALMQFSRIAQDAPYGIIGIGNNITATAEAFSYLKNQTGTTGGALKALASSLIGTGGILLAVSLVTSAFTYMSQNNISVGDLVDKLTGKFNAQKKALTELAIEATKTAGEEISSLKSVISVAQDDTLSREKRMLAVKKLQDMYPAYFGNLSTEKILNGDLTGIINRLSTALKARARASALSTKAGESASKELEIQEKLRDTYGEIFRLLKTPPSKQLKVIQDLNRGNLELTNDQVKALGALDFFKFGSLTREYTDLRGELIDVNKELNHFQKLADRDYKIQIELETPKVKPITPENVVKQVGKTPQVSPLGSSIVPSGLAETSGMVLQVAKNVQGAEGMITTSMGNIQIAFDTSGVYMLEALRNLNDGMNELISGSIADTFGQLGTAIGEALATGGNVLSAIGNTLLQSLGKFLSDMGGMLIKYGTLALVKGQLDIAIATGGPAAIVAGLAAIGVGIALKAAGSAIGSKAKGGVGQGSMQGGNSVSSPSSSTGGGGGSSFQGGTVVFEISGQSLIGVLGNTLDKNRRLGGSLSLG